MPVVIDTFHALVDKTTGIQLAHLVNAEDPNDHIVNGISPTIIEIDVELIEPVTPETLDAAIIAAGAVMGITVISHLAPTPIPVVYTAEQISDMQSQEQVNFAAYIAAGGTIP